MTACKSCGAPLRWAKTGVGKRIPLDAEPVANGNIRLGLIGGIEYAIVLPPADIACCQVDGLPLYVSHFATCPNSAQHRRRQPGSEAGETQDRGGASDAP